VTLAGCRKSTVLRLAYRLYDVQAGRITVDGQDIRSVTLSSLRRHIAVVPQVSSAPLWQPADSAHCLLASAGWQSASLFNDTAEANIAYGNGHASPDGIVQSARSAQIHQRIQSFPDGYQSMVGERGLQLSGGERQSVVLARTLLQRAPVLLLDEATSALDNETEKNIGRALAKARSGADTTMIMVAHRLSTVVDSDLIVVMADGRNLEQGTHSELVGRPGGVYRSMWLSQSGE
jgi:ABC-type transport system involved in Fe-S cluster assembly fused permease/ATPase subunit